MTYADRKELLDAIADKLTKKIQDGEYDRFHDRSFGIKSRQIMAVLDLLVENGLIQEADLKRMK